MCKISQRLCGPGVNCVSLIGAAFRRHFGATVVHAKLWRFISLCRVFWARGSVCSGVRLRASRGAQVNKTTLALVHHCLRDKRQFFLRRKRKASPGGEVASDALYFPARFAFILRLRGAEYLSCHCSRWGQEGGGLDGFY